MTPSAPRSNAFTMKSGLIRLLHGVRMIRTFGDILRRIVPARSAPVYVHQLQTKAMTFGSNEPLAAGAALAVAVAVAASGRETFDMGTPGSAVRVEARAPRVPP